MSFPRWKHHESGKSVIVQSGAHEAALGDGWHDWPWDAVTASVPVALAVEPEPIKVKGKPGPKPKVI